MKLVAGMAMPGLPADRHLRLERSAWREAAASGGQLFGILLRGHRAVAGLTQVELAELAGVSLRAVANWERGRARPRRRSAALLADALALSSKQRKFFIHAARAQPTAGSIAMPQFSTAVLGNVSQPTPEHPLQLRAAPRFVDRADELDQLNMWLRVLGPVQVRDGDAWLSPPGAQLRLLLARLALSVGQVVLVDDLIDVLWVERPPPSARASLQILVVGLRKALVGLPGCAVERYGDGYQLRAVPDKVDVHRFRSLVCSAREAPDENHALAAFDQALALWRGPALSDVPATVRVEAIRAGLAEEHLSAVQDRFGCLLGAGRNQEAAAGIPLVLAGHPLAERLAGMLMIAWYRCGRQADALQVFRDLRGRLAGELAVEPGPELQRLHQQILSADPALAASGKFSGLLRGGEANATGRVAEIGHVRPVQLADALKRPGSERDAKGAARPGNRELVIKAAPAVYQPVPARGAGVESPPGSDNMSGADMGNAAVPVIPRQLPAAPAHFVGRQRELSLLTEWLEAGTAAGQTVMLAVSGTAGVGKTALALQWAHRAKHRFADGQLYINLRGFDASSAPVAPADAISVLLESLDMPANRIPQRLDAQAGLYRSLLAGRQMLIVLDNARDEAQVRPLLPGVPTCAVLVTGRGQLGGLVAVEGARPLTLDVLSEAEAQQLLDSHLGDERVAAEAAEVAELVALCARLPLALAIIAARAALRPLFPLASLVAGLRDIRQRLDLLDCGDQGADVRAVFSWSYRLLGEPAARMFRLLGAHPGPDISVATAASLAAVSGPQARAALTDLTRANLLQEQTLGRYALHDLLHAYAADLSDEEERRSAIHRVLDHYLHTTRAAVTLVYPGACQETTPQPGPGEPAGRFSDPGQAQAWLQAEYPSLLAATVAAAESGFDTHAWQLPAALRQHFDRRGYYADWAECQLLAVAAADRLGDPAAQAQAHRLLGQALISVRHLEDAHSHLQKALKLDRRLGDQVGQGTCHYHLAGLFASREQHSRALAHHRQSLRLWRTAGDLTGQAHALNAVGWDNAQLGHYQRALGYCKEALELHRASGNRIGEATTLDSLGYCCHQAGHYSQAIAYYQQALRAYADTNDRYLRAQTLIRLGETRQANGNQEATRDLWQQALAILSDLHHPDAAPIRAKLDELTAQPGPESDLACARRGRQ
jgi:DNA-binding SARP family transcriptional activator/tetratricopeptide (TPR) repeat protein/transcriptional regulator with XRE-family HTH domain